MTLEGAIKLHETTDYIIYTMNSVTTGQYGVVVPNNINGTLNMLVDLHMKGSFDSVSSGVKTKEQLVNEINEEYGKLKTKFADGMLVIPMIDEGLFQSAVVNSDKQKMFDEVKKIGAITSELYKKLTDQGVDKQKIDQKIIVVEKNSEDEKFVSWLKEQMPNFVDGILYSELSNTSEIVNSNVAIGDIFGTAKEVEVPKVEEPIVNNPVNGGVFDNVVPEVPVTPVEAVVSNTPVVEPVVQATVSEQNVNPVPAASNELFENATNNVVVEAVNTPVQEAVVASVPVQEPVVTAVPVEEPVAASTSVQPEGPKPVESAMLEGTIAFTPIPNHPNNPAPVAEEVNENAVSKGSKGFANLLILLVVLVGVTIASIELGKFLYNVYGA